MSNTQTWLYGVSVWAAREGEDDWCSAGGLIRMAEERCICGDLLAASLHIRREHRDLYADDLDELWDDLKPSGKTRVIEWNLQFNRDFLRHHYTAWLAEHTGDDEA